MLASTVPNSVDGKFKIVNSEFLDEFNDHDSAAYQTMAKDIEAGIMESLQDYKSALVKVFNLT